MNKSIKRLTCVILIFFPFSLEAEYRNNEFFSIWTTGSGANKPATVSPTLVHIQPVNRLYSICYSSGPYDFAKLSYSIYDKNGIDVLNKENNIGLGNCSDIYLRFAQIVASPACTTNTCRQSGSFRMISP